MCAIAKRHAVELDDFESERWSPLWQTTFAPAPVACERTAEALGLEYVLGRATASSLGTPGRASLVSRTFTLDHDELAFVVQDFGGPRTRVELHVGGAVVRSLQGARERGLRAVSWDVAELRGREAVLAVRDDDPDPARGIGLDAVALFDRTAAE